jgi:hypothetical protein
MARREGSGLSDIMLSAAQRDAMGAKATQSPNFTWLTAPKNLPHKDVTSVVRRLVRDQNPRLVENTRFASLYANQDFLRPSNGAATQGRAGASSGMPRQTLNLIKVYTDTLAGKLVQSNSRVQAVTIQGDWETFKLSRKLGRLLDSTFLQGHLYRECSKFLLDALQFGIGYLYVGEEDGKIHYERWYHNEMFVDQLDAMYGRPTMLFRIRYMYPDNANGIWGNTEEKRKIINRSPRAIPPTFSWTPYESGMIEVFEAWAIELPNRPGRHVLCTAGGTLIDEPYKRDCFPVVAFRASELQLGWYGQGFTAHSAGTQVWLNRILDIMAKSAHLGLAPFWITQGGATVSLKQLNNAEGHVVSSDGPPPQWVTNKPFHESAPQYVELLKTQMGAIYGISEIESTGAMPLNRLDSNPALIQAQDMWMARHTILLKNWSEECFLDIAERTIEVAQDIAKKKGSYPVVATAAGRAWGMDWKDFIKLEREKYRLQLGAENALPLTPAARKKMAMNMASQGLTSPDRAMQVMMGSSDIDALTSDVTAFQNNADWLIEQLYEGEMPEMSDLQKPDVVYDRIRAAGLMAHEYGAPDEVIQAFEVFGAKVFNMIQQAQQQAAALAAPPATGAPGGPTPGPTAQ